MIKHNILIFHTRTSHNFPCHYTSWRAISNVKLAHHQSFPAAISSHACKVISSSVTARPQHRYIWSCQTVLPIAAGSWHVRSKPLASSPTFTTLSYILSIYAFSSFQLLLIHCLLFFNMPIIESIHHSPSAAITALYLTGLVHISKLWSLIPPGRAGSIIVMVSNWQNMGIEIRLLKEMENKLHLAWMKLSYSE